MRNQYPLSSQELNDVFVTAYGDLCYLLGYDDGSNRYSGLYERIEESGLAYLSTTSGIPHIGTDDSKYHIGLDDGSTSSYVIQYLKFDYIYRKIRNFI